MSNARLEIEHQCHIVLIHFPLCYDFNDRLYNFELMPIILLYTNYNFLQSMTTNLAKYKGNPAPLYLFPPPSTRRLLQDIMYWIPCNSVGCMGGLFISRKITTNYFDRTPIVLRACELQITTLTTKLKCI